MITARLNKYVKRYTTLSSALETLIKRKLVLLSPTKWDDSNDAYFLELYRTYLGAKSVVALCCTMAPETYHHWKVFTQGIEGVCIEFERAPLSRSLNDIEDVVAKPVEYLKIKELKQTSSADFDRLPFIKRVGYRDEREWRVFGTCLDVTAEYRDVAIEIQWINRIILNPWMPPSLVDNLRGVVKSIQGCSRLSVVSSRLTNSKTWKDAGKDLFKAAPDASRSWTA